MSSSTLRTPKDIKSLGTILSIWAHPDDESYSAAGIMAAAIKNGQRVVCITATKGEAGVQDESRWPAAKLGEIREQEMKEALDKLGIHEHHWLGYRDGMCNKVEPAEAEAKLEYFIETMKPDSILTWGPDGLTGHPDHQTVSKWVDALVKGKDIDVYHAVQNKKVYDGYLKEADKRFNIFYNIDEPPLMMPEDCAIAFDLTPDLLTQKLEALNSMPSQTESILKNTPEDELGFMLGSECFVKS